MVTATQKI